jgi:signal transduction histidine kinase
MNKKNQPGKINNQKLSVPKKEMAHSINLAIVGGGKACKFFLEIFKSEFLPFLDINVVGVCDINPEAEGFVMAKEMGIFTTDNFQELFKIEKLDSIIEITGSTEVLKDIIRLRPKGIGVLEHNIGRLMRRLFEVNQSLNLAKQRLLLKKTFSDFLIQQSTAAIVIVNTDFTIAEVNQAYLKAVNKSKGEVIGKHCYQISHGYNMPCSRWRPDMQCPLVETLRTGKSAHVIHDHPGPGGTPTFCNLVTYPLRAPDGEILQVIEVWRDITEQLSYRWEKQVNELKSDLQKMVQEDRMISLGKLAASCAHEINNPIQGLLTFSRLMEDVLAEGDPSTENLEQFKKHLSLMSRELERCGNIISGLLSFSREAPEEYKDIDINDALLAAILLTRHQIKLKNIDLTILLDSRALKIKGNDRELQQCFLNLIFNAIEAMPDGGELKIISELIHDDKKARIEIHDSGYGIPQEHLNNIFDPFFTTKEEGEGTGLGLSIVYGIIKNHKGNVEINSNVGEGSSFVLDFPLLEVN